MKTKTASVVVKAQEQEMHRQEEESRWAAEMHTTKGNETTQEEEDSRWAAVKEKEGVDAAKERQEAIEKLQALEEKRQAQDSCAPSKECWQLKDFPGLTVRQMKEAITRMNGPGQTAPVVYRHPSLCTGTFRRCAQGHFEDVASTKCTTGTGPVVELQQAVGQAKARMVFATRSYAEANGRSDSEEASDGEGT